MGSFEDIFSESELKREEEPLVLIDNREKNSLAAHLVAQKVCVSFENLSIGDYVIGDLAIERKTFRDLLSSVYDGRLFRQLKELSALRRAVVLLEGDEAFLEREKKIFYSTILSIKADYKVPVIRTLSPEESASVVLEVVKRQGKKPRSFGRKGGAGRGILQRRKFVLEGFPGIGPFVAESLLDNFSSLREIFNADKSELEKIRGFSEKKVDEFLEILGP